MEDAFLANASASYEDIERNGAPSDPLPFDEARIGVAVRVDANVYIPATNETSELSNIVYEHHPDGRPPERGYLVGHELSGCTFGVIRACDILIFRNAPDALWELTGRRAAVKVMSWQRIRASRHARDPLQEVAAMQFVARDGMHPPVMGAMDVLQDEEYLLLFMPLCSTGDLFGSVELNGRFPEPMARYLFKQILEGVSHLQRMGVCHRGMSLEKILLDQDDKSTIIDLGMCLRVPFAADDNDGQVTDVATGNLRLLMNSMMPCGKPYYMSPEIILSEPFDGFAIDLWATGVILFIMLVGLPPWEFARVEDPRFRMVMSGGLARMLESWGRQVSEPAADLLQKMLKQNPRDRLSLRQVMDHPWVLDEDVTGAFPPQP